LDALHAFTQLKTSRTSAPFPVRHVDRYPAHYRLAFAFSCLLFPLWQQLPLRITCPEYSRGHHNGLAEFRMFE